MDGTNSNEQAEKQEAIKSPGLDVLMDILNRKLKHPPSHPNWNPGWPDYCDEDRFFDLALWAFSEAEYAIDNRLSSEEQKKIIIKLEAECSDVMDIVLRSMQEYKQISSKQRIDYFRDFKRYNKKLVDFVEAAMQKGVLDRTECHKIIHEHSDLLREDGLMLSIKIEKPINNKKVTTNVDNSPGNEEDEIIEINEGKTNDKDELTWQAKAIALAIDHRDWTTQKIANKVGKSRQSLYKDELVANALKARNQQKRPDKSHYPKGEKDSKTGNVEAF